MYGTDLAFWVAKVICVTAGTLGMMCSLTSFRYSLKKVFTIFGIYLILTVLLCLIFFELLDVDGILTAYIFTIATPIVIMGCKISKDLKLQSAFNFATQVTFSLAISMAMVIFNEAIDGNKLSELLISVVAYATVIILEYRLLRRNFRRLTEVIKTGWGMLSLIPISFCMLIMVMGTLPIHFMYHKESIMYIFGLMVTMIIVYFTIFQSLSTQYKVLMLVRDKDILQVQVENMKKQANAVVESKTKMKILRHDIRHFASVMEATLKEGSVEKAVEILTTFKGKISEGVSKSYCEDFIINSFLASYFEKAEKDGTVVNVKFSPPLIDTIDSTAFAVMLANAIENSVNACENVIEPEISLKSRVFNGQYVMELTNTCDGTVTFDDDGLPVSRNSSEHGIGTRSIIAFAKQHDATVSFRLEDNRFIFQIMFSVEEQ